MGRVPCCSICMEVLKDFTDISAGPCGHTFHQLCLKGWMDKCESRHQPPACPHCMKRFECQPATGIIDCLYFALESEDDSHVQQKRPKEKLSEEVASREAEIRRLRAVLDRVEEENDLAAESLAEIERDIRKMYEGSSSSQNVLIDVLWEKVSVRDSEIEALQERLKVIDADRDRLKEEKNEAIKNGSDGWRRTLHALKDMRAQKEEAEESLDAERSENNQMKALLRSLKAEKTALQDQVKALNKLVEEMKSSSDRSSDPASRDIFATRHVVISNLDARITTNAIWVLIIGERY